MIRAIQLMATMNAGPGKNLPATVLETSASGTRLAFEPTGFPRFQIGAPVEVSFVQLGVDRPLVTLGQVCNQARIEGRPTLGIRFTNTGRFYQQLTPELWTQFDRRWRNRIPLDGQAKIQSGGRQWAAPVHDICAGGVSLDLDPGPADELGAYELVRLFAELPLEGGMIFPTCLLVHQTPFGRQVRHGMSFDPSLTVDLEDLQDRIDAFARTVEAGQKRE